MTLASHVAALMRHVAETEILPRFRMLAAHEIVEKSPGEIVTSADVAAEARLREGLERLEGSARVVGEEACAADPRLLDAVGKGLVWLVDPLDGTANFAAGVAPFGMMVALVSDGEAVAGWMLDPLSGRLCRAERGLGAWIDERPVHIRPAARSQRVAALATQFMAPADRSRIRRIAERRFTLEPIPRCAAESYPRLVTGRNDVALFQRILPWDHAPGALFLTEAGGRATHWDGTPYRIGGTGTGLLAANGDAAWQEAAAALQDPLAAIGTPEALAA